MKRLVTFAVLLLSCSKSPTGPAFEGQPFALTMLVQNGLTSTDPSVWTFWYHQNVANTAALLGSAPPTNTCQLITKVLVVICDSVLAPLGNTCVRINETPLTTADTVFAGLVAVTAPYAFFNTVFAVTNSGIVVSGEGMDYTLRDVSGRYRVNYSYTVALTKAQVGQIQITSDSVPPC